MNNLLGNLNVKLKLYAIGGISFLGCLVILSVSLFILEQNLLGDRKEKTQHLVQSAYTLVNHFYKMEKSGQLSQADAQSAAISAVSELRYGEDDYFWINDMAPKMVVHPLKPSLNGKDLSKTIDPNGVALFNEAVKTVKTGGEGFIEYAWEKPGHEEPVKKISYVQGFAPWGWVIGSGIYIDDVHQIFFQSAINFGAIALVFLLIASVVAGLISNQLTRQISNLNSTMHSVRQSGNLTLRTEPKGKDEIATMGQSFNHLLERFHETLGHVTQTVSTLDKTASEMGAVTVQTSEGMQRQCTESEQLATAMEEMASTAHEVARSAATAETSARTASEYAENGQGIVSNTISSINNLSTSIDQAANVIDELGEDANNIGTVLDVIRGIADQTNLLALNAAIEAARAGEQGRGFAVVADEVRSLAQRTQESTEEIQVMIERLQSRAQNAVSSMETGRSQVGNSVIQAKEAGESLDMITSAVTQIRDMNIQIANAAEEQTAVADEMSANITAISQVAMETAEGSQVIRSAGDSLQDLTTQSRSVLAQFQF